jgi:ATP-dependent metalloprotease
MKKEASINPAVRRRESLLAAHPLTTPSLAPTPAPTQQADPSQVPSAPEEPPVTPIPSPIVSRSQQIASSVLAGTTVEHVPPSIEGLGSPGQPLSPDMVKLLAALGAGKQGGNENPVHVIIRERESYTFVSCFDRCSLSSAGKGAWIPSFARFLVFAGIATFCKSPLPFFFFMFAW